MLTSNVVNPTKSPNSKITQNAPKEVSPKLNSKKQGERVIGSSLGVVG